MKSNQLVKFALFLLGLVVLAGLMVKTQSQVKPPGAYPAAEEISRSRFFGQRIVPVGGGATEAESQLLLLLLNVTADSDYQTGLDDLEEFQNTYTNSPWTPSLDAALGRYYYELGRYTLALAHWELAWDATKDYPNGNGKGVADYVLANWTRLLAKLGRYEVLTNLVQETRGRVLDRGRLSQQWGRTREAIVDMARNPGISYRCGTFALNAVARELQVKYDPTALLNLPSPASGFSLSYLAQLSTRFGLGLYAVGRTGGGEIPVPAVVHWRQNHYAAILSRRGDFYKVVDPTFGRPRYMTAETINAEASGYFLAPAAGLTANFHLVGPAEADLVVGRGNPNFLQDSDDQYCSCEDAGECPTGPSGATGSHGGDGNRSNIVKGDNPQPGCGSCGGMPVWRVSEPYINLWLDDEPSAYQPALGRRVAVRLTYKQRSEDIFRPAVSDFSSFGHHWHCPWFSTVFLGLNGAVTLNYAQGGEAAFQQSDLVGSAGLGNYYNNLKFRAVTNGAGVCTSYELLYPNGAKDVYGYASTNRYSFIWFYLTQKISPEGFTTSFQYDADAGFGKVWLKYVVDADGRTNSLYYTDPFNETEVTQVTDPYGRSAYFQYDEYYLLTNITDSAGMSSSVSYDANGVATALVTPYGTTTFDFVDKSANDQTARQGTISDPNNGTEIYAFVENYNNVESLYGVLYYPAAQVPTNTPIGTLNNTNLWSRNSYHWSRLQTPTLSTTDVDYMVASDFLKARLRHWLGEYPDGENLLSMDTLSLERAYSPDGSAEGQKTWYDYPGKEGGESGNKGAHILPGVVARVLPDGSTWYQWLRRDSWGQPTNIVETYTQPDGAIGLRTNQFVYATNGLDLVRHLGPQGEQVVSNYFGNTYHQVDASYDALAQVTRYTYNGYRQLTSIKSPAGLTTTNLYFSSGDALNRLDKIIDLEIKRTNSYTYANDLVYSHTDERGLTVTNYWDGLQRLVGMKYPDGTTTSNRYTALDITARKDRLGYWSYASYNGIRQKVAETNANGVVTRYGLCDCGAILSVTNAWSTPVQMVTSFGYDLQGNRIYTYYPDATVTNWFDSLQRVIATCDAWGCEWYSYNNQGLATSVTNAFGAKQITVFDFEDRPIYVTDANNVTLTNTYDDLGRLRTRTAPDGGVEAFGYSARGLIAYTNQIGHTNFYAYDEARRKTCETNANWEVIRYTNSPAGDLLALVDGKNQVTKWNYDEYGRVTNKVDQVGAAILRYTYDADSRLVSRWSKQKGTTYYTNDAVGNLTKINYPASPDVTLAYDPLNRVTNMVDAAGTTKYTYTVGGQLYTEDGPFASDTVTNTWNNRLRVGLDLQQPTGVWTNRFAYDAAKRLTNVTSPAGSFAYLLPDTRPSHLVSRTALPNSSYITNTYDGNARLLTTKLLTSSSSLLNSHSYSYNPAHQRTQQVFNAGSTVNYTYDPIGQLKVADSATASEDRGYNYDTAWNLHYRTNNTTLNTLTVDGKNQLTTALGGNCGYDSNGNLTNYNSGAVVYSYDDENQLTWAEDVDKHKWATTFVYDGLGRLRKRVEYAWSGVWTVYTTTWYLYDGRRVIQERNASNVPQVSYTRGTDLSGTLEGAGGIGGLLGRSHGYSAGNWSTHNFYHADGNGNITYLVNSSQGLAASYRYDPFGNTISSSGTLASANVYRFSSKELHVNSGLYYYGYRFYDPNTQRWLNRDPIGERGGVNLYRFCFNAGINYSDPHGLQYQQPPINLPDGTVIIYTPTGASGGGGDPGNWPVASPVLPPGFKCEGFRNGAPIISGTMSPPIGPPVFLPPIFLPPIVPHGPPRIPRIPCSICDINRPPPIIIRA